jgi:glycosyltransferase involved in cell wall biosynthesis
MRIAMDGRSLVSSALRGWDRYTVELVREFAKRDLDVTLFYRTGEPICNDHLEGVRCELIGLDCFKVLQWEQVALPNALRRGRYDLYHAPTDRAIPLCSPCPALMTIHSLTRHSYRNLIQTGEIPGPLSDYIGPEPKRRWQMYWNAQVARASHIFTPSEFSKGEIVKFLGLPPERITTTPLGVPAQFQTPPRARRIRQATLEKWGIKQPYLLYVGGYESHKNVVGLLRTFALVRASRPDVSLVLVGTREVPAELTSLAVDLGLHPGKDLFFLLNLDEELTDLYDETELFVTLSWRESFGLPALEAMARGRRVMGSAWGAMREVVGVFGPQVDPRNHAAAAGAVLKILAEPLTAEFEGLLRKRASQFSWHQTADLTLEVYDQFRS